MAERQEASAATQAGSELERRLVMSKRRFTRILLASAATYSVPLMASFSMEGLRIGTAEAGGFPPGIFVANQVPPGPPFNKDNLPPGPPFASNQPPPGPPFLP
jgi:hypothetical protein